jgi:hypothetical protein
VNGNFAEAVVRTVRKEAGIGVRPYKFAAVLFFCAGSPGGGR